VLFASQWRAATRIVAVVCLVSCCGSGVTARSISDQLLGTLSPTDPLSPPETTLPSDVQLPTRGPFGLADSKDGPLAARWRNMQAAFIVEERVLSLCRTNPAVCTPAATRFLAIVDSAREHSGRARVGAINRAVNLAIRPVSDLAQYGLADVWATPLMTFASGAGDCEDYAIAKYVALRQIGMAENDLRLVIVHDRQIHQDHAVVAARMDGQWLILDSRTMVLLTDVQVHNLMPLLVLNGEGDTLPVMAAAPQQDEDRFAL